MTIDKHLSDDALTLKIVGRLDTTTTPELEETLDDYAADIKELVLDLADLEYISSAGLRVILKAQKLMSGKGAMRLINVNEEIMEIFNITGFADILTIE